MKERPILNKNLNSKKFIEFYYLKEELVDFCRKAVEIARNNGTWNALKSDIIANEQIEEFTEKLAGNSPAYENFNNMSPSVRLTYKTQRGRLNEFEKIVDMLNNNLKPM